MTYRYRLLPGGYVDETGVHRGVPPTQEDYDRIALLYAHRTLFKEGPIKPQVLDPLPPEDAMQLYRLKSHISVLTTPNSHSKCQSKRQRNGTRIR